MEIKNIREKILEEIKKKDTDNLFDFETKNINSNSFNLTNEDKESYFIFNIK